MSTGSIKNDAQSPFRKECFFQQFKFSSTDLSWFQIDVSNQWYLTSLHKFPNLRSKLTGLSFSSSYFSAPNLTLKGSSLTLFMSITLYIYLLIPKVAGNLVLRFGLKAKLSKLAEFDSFQKHIFWEFRDLWANECSSFHN